MANHGAANTGIKVCHGNYFYSAFFFKTLAGYFASDHASVILSTKTMNFTSGKTTQVRDGVPGTGVPPYTTPATAPTTTAAPSPGLVPGATLNVNVTTTTPSGRGKIPTPIWKVTGTRPQSVATPKAAANDTAGYIVTVDRPSPEDILRKINRVFSIPTHPSPSPGYSLLTPHSNFTPETEANRINPQKPKPPSPPPSLPTTSLLATATPTTAVGGTASAPVATNFTWEFSDLRGGWIPYDQAAQQILENARTNMVTTVVYVTPYFLLSFFRTRPEF
jgi:hypothetical protein